MSIVEPPHTPTPRHDRPEVSEVSENALGRSFTITFQAGQSLPRHSNPSRIAITALRGAGTVFVSDDAGRQLVAGDFVQLEPGVFHALTAGEEGLEVTVSFIENCCRMC